MGKAMRRASTIATRAVIAIACAASAMHATRAEPIWGKVRSMGAVQPSDPMVPFTPNATYLTCFTPGQDCEGVIVDQINRATKSILMQAYAFTSTPIARALIHAKQRGVDVRAIVDRGLRTDKYSGAKTMLNAGIPVAVDEQPASAHSKVLIFDQRAVLTGSFNFTRAAQQRNSENLILIAGDARLVQVYTANWTARWIASVPY